MKNLLVRDLNRNVGIFMNIKLAACLLDYKMVFII